MSDDIDCEGYAVLRWYSHDAVDIMAIFIRREEAQAELNATIEAYEQAKPS